MVAKNKLTITVEPETVNQADYVVILHVDYPIFASHSLEKNGVKLRSDPSIPCLGISAYLACGIKLKEGEIALAKTTWRKPLRIKLKLS